MPETRSQLTRHVHGRGREGTMSSKKEVPYPAKVDFRAKGFKIDVPAHTE